MSGYIDCECVTMQTNNITCTAAVLLLSWFVAAISAARFPGCRRRSTEPDPDFSTRILTCRLTPGNGTLVPPDDK